MQAFSKNLESGYPECAIGPAEIDEQVIRQHMKNEMIFYIETGHPQDAWTPVWLKA